mmetsp:Transcript_68084/g.121281  ORF Transcript_68084/g.121281 Transcript_68084/m.121281 type:complete len:290 (-) Transcript_68084:80-949(-)
MAWHGWTSGASEEHKRDAGPESERLFRTAHLHGQAERASWGQPEAKSMPSSSGVSAWLSPGAHAEQGATQTASAEPQRSSWRGFADAEGELMDISPEAAKSIPHWTPLEANPYRRMLPMVGGFDPMWNVHPCQHGQKCSDLLCRGYHSEAERRCPCHSSGMLCSQSYNGRCSQGLHVDVPSICKVLTLDFLCASDMPAQLQIAETWPMDECARHVRIVILGFETTGMQTNMLLRFCRVLPMLHELCFADKEMTWELLLSMCDLMEKCAQTNPRLRDVIFKDGSVVPIWL